MTQANHKTNDETRERFVWGNLIQPIIEAYGIKGLKYQHTPCTYDLSDDIKMERLIAMTPNARPFNSFNELFLKWTNGVQGVGEFSYKNYFIEFMNYLKEEGTLPHFLRFIAENYLTDEQPNNYNPIRKPERKIKWISFDDLKERWNSSRYNLMQIISYYIDNKDKAFPVYYHLTGLTYVDDVEPCSLPIQDWSAQADTVPERMVFNIEDIQRLDPKYIRTVGKELTSHEIKEKILDARANGFIDEIQLAEFLAADPQYRAILPKLWKKFELDLRGPEEPDPSTYEKRVPIWHQLLLRWTTGTVQGAKARTEIRLLDTRKPGSIKLQALKEFLNNRGIPLPVYLFQPEAIPPKKRTSKYFNHVSPINTRAGTKWDDVEITFINDEEILIQYYGDRAGHADRKYNNAGFEDKRNGKPIKTWWVLHKAAGIKGEIPVDFINKSILEKDVEKLNKKLSDLFPGVFGRPIKFNKRKGGYVFAFRLKTNFDYEPFNRIYTNEKGAGPDS